MEQCRDAALLMNADALEEHLERAIHVGIDPSIYHFYRSLVLTLWGADLNAAIGLPQVRRLEEVLKKRKELAEYYSNNLKDRADLITLPYVAPHNKHSWFLYAILVEDPDAVDEYCRDKGIVFRRSWPLPIHRQPVYRDIIGSAVCPVAEYISSHIINLPMYYTMTHEEQDYVIKHLKDAVKRR